MKILIIDDDEIIRELFRMWLERAGYEVYDAADGREGMAIQEKTPVDMLICDLIMPVQEGIETITLFNDKFPEIGIIAISGGGKIAPGSYLTIAEHLGAWKVFTKPVDMIQLMKDIEEWTVNRGVGDSSEQE
ncbi:transcriptional regulator [Desulfomarina profundi]|uniref:Transcriptional regulator n=1 Tax=Desulfomarina profundi TaxID=2772557 RepID=A0A8D5FVX2_9BACT|nr:response regulator [Desulfomarina profundi]BCL60887.1 transcriptional regulator [Desulfomarina profundi]